MPRQPPGLSPAALGAPTRPPPPAAPMPAPAASAAPAESPLRRAARRRRAGPRLARFLVPPDPSMEAVDLRDLLAAFEAELARATRPASPSPSPPAAAALAGADAAPRGAPGSDQAAGAPAAAAAAAPRTPLPLEFRRAASALEALIAVELIAFTRELRWKLSPFDPRRPPPAAGAAPDAGDDAAEAEAALDAAEADALGSLVDLLLAARYTPLTAAQWRDARGSVFTSDIPLKIQWEALDPAPIRRHLGLDTAAAPGAPYRAPAGAAGAGAGAAWGALPPFSDRVLVFVRGVGAASARGQYYSEKLDLLVSYVLLEPLAAAASAAWRAAGAPLITRLPAAARLADWLKGKTPFDEFDDPETSGYGGTGMAAPADVSSSMAAPADVSSGMAAPADVSSGMAAPADASTGMQRGPGGAGAAAAAGGGAAPRSAALARLEAAAAAPAAAAAARRRRQRVARYVTRRTLRALLPGVVDVALALPREELLTEPTCGWSR
jgi:hypothetical protein